MKRLSLLFTMAVLIAFPITTLANENNGTPGMYCHSGDILSPGYTCVNNVITEGLQASGASNPTDELSGRPADQQEQLDTNAFNTNLTLYLIAFFF